MIRTAEQLSQIKNKTIVLTGASKPEKFTDSDACFNIGIAVAGAEILSHGVYIAMSGRIYKWDKCKKERKTGKFIEI